MVADGLRGVKGVTDRGKSGLDGMNTEEDTGGKGEIEEEKERL